MLHPRSGGSPAFAASRPFPEAPGLAFARSRLLRLQMVTSVSWLQAQSPGLYSRVQH